MTKNNKDEIYGCSKKKYVNNSFRNNCQFKSPIIDVTDFQHDSNENSTFSVRRKGELDTEINANELILIYKSNSNKYELVEFCNANIDDNTFTYGLDENRHLNEIRIEQLKRFSKITSIYIKCKYGTLALSEQHSLFSVDENLNIIKIPVKNIKEGTPILMPRIIEVIEDHSPLDFSNCGEIIDEKGIQYVKKARTKAFRFVKKSFEVGFILGQYCAEGSMNEVTISCGNNKSEMERVANLVEKNFGLKPSISKHNKKGYDTVYSVESNTNLAKLLFTEGLGLRSKYAPLKEIPPFLYNAPIECIRGFIAGFIEGDGSIGEYTRENSKRRDIMVRFSTSSRKLVFGLGFLLKRLKLVASINKREFDDIEHPTWYDAYTLLLSGKKNMNILRKFVPNIPEIGNFARDTEPPLDLNRWMKRLNLELKDLHNISLRMLSEKKKVPYIAARCAQKNSTMNISEAKMLETLDFLKKRGYITPVVNKLFNIFEKHTFTKIKTVETNNELNYVYNLLIQYNGIYIAGIGQIYIN